MVSISNKRTPLSEPDLILLASQVGFSCPLCTVKIIYEKNQKRHKNFEVAHIYPLNPTNSEKDILTNVEQLNPDVNHLDNLIPLCPNCHTKFDKPRTREGYENLLQIKKEFLRRFEQHDVWNQFKVEEDLKKIIEGIYKLGSAGENTLSYDPLSVDQKLNSSMLAPTKFKIKGNVSIYYMYIKQRMVELDAEKENASTIIAHQVKAYFLKTSQTSKDQQKIFQNIVSWIEFHFKPQSIEAAEIITSFFIQNCEIF